MYLKSSLVIILALSVNLGYWYNNYPVPDEVDNKYAYKITGFVVSTTGFLGKTLAWLNVGDEISNIRSIMTYAVKTEGLRKSELGVEIADRTVNGVNVRTYEPGNKPSGKMPALIYFHGGGYAFGTPNTYDPVLEKIVEKQKLVAINVDYRMSPEHPFPTPTDDCYAVTKYVFEHPEEFSIDPDRVILAGDSAGGNVVAALTQRFLKEKGKQPKLQVLIYPWMQMANVDLPSFQLYNDLGWFREIGIGFGEYTKWYLNISAEPAKIFESIKSFDHVKGPEQASLREKLLKYLDTSIIPSEFINKKEEEYYKNYSRHIQQALNQPKGPRSKILEDKNVQSALLKVFDDQVSPGLADTEKLVGLPKAHFVICELDSLKDEALIYAERLKQAGVGVNVKYYKSAFHGIMSFVRPPLDFKAAQEINDDIQAFIAANI